jgi:hypothetical protein
LDWLSLCSIAEFTYGEFDRYLAELIHFFLNIRKAEKEEERAKPAEKSKSDAGFDFFSVLFY